MTPPVEPAPHAAESPDEPGSSTATQLPRGARFAGLAVIVLTFLSALALIALIAIAAPRPFWGLQEASLWGIEILYNSHAPATGLVISAIVFAVLIGLSVSFHEAWVIRRNRRTDPTLAKRPLSPRRIMDATRGVYHGPVTITALIPAHN